LRGQHGTLPILGTRDIRERQQKAAIPRIKSKRLRAVREAQIAIEDEIGEAAHGVPSMKIREKIVALICPEVGTLLAQPIDVNDLGARVSLA